MPTFKIEIIETLSKIVSIEANSEEEAIATIQDLYKDENIVLDADDLADTAFVTVEE